LLLAAVATVPLVVGTVPFGSQLMLSPFSSPAVTLLGVLVGASALAWVIAFARGEAPLRYHALLLAIAAMLVLMAVATLRSLDSLYSLFGDGDDLNGLLVYSSLALTTFLALAHCTNSKRVATLTSTVIYSGAVVAGIALFQQLFAVDVFREVPAEQWAEIGWLVTQGASTLGNPNFTGNWLVFPATLALYRAVRPGQERSHAIRNAIIAVLLLVALVLTLTRGAWIGIGVAGAVWLAVTFVRNRRLPREFAVAAGVAGLVLVGILVFAGSELARRVSELFSPGLHGLTGRTLVWGEALAIIRSYPLLGTGPAAFRLGWYAVRTIPGLVAGANVVATDAHSVPLTIAATAGIPALACAGTAFLGTLVTSGKLVWNRGSRVSSDYIAWWASALALGVTSLAAMSTAPFLLALFLAMGVLLAPLSREITVSSHARVAYATLLGVLGLASVLNGGVQGISHSNARAALAISPQAVRAVAENPPYSGTLAAIAARLESQQLLAAASTMGSASVASEIETIYEPLVRRHPNDYEFLMWWSTQLFIAGDALDDHSLLERGLEISERAIELYPNAVPLRTNRARALLELGRTDEARAELAPYASKESVDYPALDEVWAALGQ
jgi:O-antigen ligase